MEKKNKPLITYRIRGVEVQQGDGKYYTTLIKGTPAYEKAAEFIAKKINAVYPKPQPPRDIERQEARPIGGSSVQVKCSSGNANTTIVKDSFSQALEERGDQDPHKPTVTALLQRAIDNIDCLNDNILLLTGHIRAKINWSGPNVITTTQQIHAYGPLGMEAMVNGILSRIETATKEVGELKDFVNENL